MYETLAPLRSFAFRQGRRNDHEFAPDTQVGSTITVATSLIRARRVGVSKVTSALRPCVSETPASRTDSMYSIELTTSYLKLLLKLALNHCKKPVFHDSVRRTKPVCELVSEFRCLFIFRRNGEVPHNRSLPVALTSSDLD